MPDTPPITFTDGAAYEKMMGAWSLLAGDVFLDWLAPAKGLRWADIGCGNGAFTELLAKRCAPAAVEGIDPSEGQIAYARTRGRTGAARFQTGDAMALPYADKSFDAAVMALVIFFVPEPAKGVAEMARVLRPGGVAAAYAWDIEGGGFPWEMFWIEVRALGLTPRQPPSSAASRLDVMRELWTGAGFTAVETRQIDVTRTFENFEEFWRIGQSGPGTSAQIAEMGETKAAALKDRLRAKLSADAAGRITCGARANAVKGRLPD